MNLVENILAVYRAARPEQIAEGVAWYADAHNYALSLDRNIFRAAGIIAALSPRMPWERNMTLAARVYADGAASGTLKANTRKADAIFHGADPLTVFATSDKVRNFYLNIVDPTGDGVTIDRHAYDIAMGEIGNDESRRALSRKGEYDRIAAAYREAAFTVGVSPSQMQAVTWVVWREAKGIA